MSSPFPKILIVGQPFKTVSGGGITLTNLFKGWPKDRIAVAATAHIMYNVTIDICNTYYQLGNEEHKWIFPFNLIQKSFQSGLMSFTEDTRIPSNPKKKGIRYKFVNQIFYPFMKWTGLFHCISKITLSPGFRTWLTEYHPELLYFQISSREEILFASKLRDLLNIPTVIHMMDDWPSTIASRGPLKKYWSKRIEKEFRHLLNKIEIHLSISDAMSEEYFKRYHRHFKAFHNPIDVSKYDFIVNKTKKPENKFRILYIGRIGVANKQSIFSFSSAVSQYKVGQFEIELDIYTPDIDTVDAQIVSNLKKIRVLPAVNHDKVPGLLTSYNLLLLPLDFTRTGLKFAQYSIPTKASEYMISGTPILVFAPKETAISKFCSDNRCGYCLTVNSKEEIFKAIDILITDEKYRKEISENAVSLAKELFDAEKVRIGFQSLLVNITATGTYV